LPGCPEPVGHQRQRKRQRVGVIFPEPVQQFRYFENPCIVELPDHGRERFVELRQRIACAQHAQHLGQVATGRVRSGIGGELDAGLISAIRRAERILERFDDLGLESGGDPQGAALIVGGDQLVLISFA
jgi:hypothetical protein